MKKITLLLFLLFINLTIFAQNSQKLSREDYINTYKDIAIREMHRSGVPASITLAQGMLESDNGNSTLAVKGNNHFGIKCHSSWTGKKVYHDDDKKQECFRKYKSAEDSYIDHSDFLINGSRYDFLFDLQSDDYKNWAKGLKKAGYATANKYDDMLIKIIEDNELHQYDLVQPGDGEYKGRRPGNEYSEGRTILSTNRIDYILVEEGDGFESLRKELNLLRFELFRYNELTADSMLVPGQILYLQPKRNKAEPGNELHKLQEGESLYMISQKYGVKLRSLYEKNHWEYGFQPEKGTEILLRKAKPGVFKLKKPKWKEPEEETMELEFEFDN
ncbi:MAG: glucosaminidase domain-containing protein [Bacteroidales bacterium]|nr:glucosaminidase domain-containing protein [Bacteroidales bacterium]MCF8391449.1 glucosaminidase domain-containing protein [Bacteroidales bacterium]